jgi:hypothetical protein
MNKFLVSLGLIIGQTTSLAWGSSYLLHLKNGNELRTPYYWEEGNEIKFFIYGGVAGIHKGFVSKVTWSDWHNQGGQSFKENAEDNQPSVIVHSPKSKETPQILKGTEETTLSDNSNKDEIIDFNDYRKRKASLKEKLEDALQRNREAIAKKDLQAKDQTRKEYLEFSKQIIDLGDELKRKNKGLLPAWWEE